jgi:FAD/FMN-containing dehydrogenase
VTSSRSEWGTLRRAISGEVLLPDSGEYERARKSFIARFDEIEPQGVVRCSAPEDLAEAIAFARRHDIETATRSGADQVV